MNEQPKTWDATMTLFRSDFRTAAEYRRAYRECVNHYGFKVRIEGGWQFFEFASDYATWKAQK